MNPFSLSEILILVTALPLGYFVYAQNKAQPANKLWIIYTLSLCCWGAFGTLIGTTVDPTKALLYWRLAMGLGIVWMPVLFYHFAYLYAPWKDREILIGSYAITLALAISAFTPYYIPRVEFLFGSLYWARPGIAFHILTLWWFVMTGYSHTKLYLDSKNMPKERQNQIKDFILASIVGYLGGLLNFSICYGLNIYPWGNFLVVIYPFIMAYAIIAHGLFDIFIFVKRVFSTAIMIGITSWVIGSLSALSGFLQYRFGVSPWIFSVVAAIVAVYIAYLFIKSARDAEKAKQEFITIAAHKLRTPLTHIHYIVDELRQVRTKEETDALVTNLAESNELIVSLVNKLLDVTNLETQSENYKFSPVDLKVITSEVIQSMGPLLRDKKIRLAFQSEESLPQIEGYEKSLKFVIQSLIENAAKYTPENGEVNISISKDEKNITWTIQDSGIGIANEDIYKIFEKFFRGDNALKADTEGTGLALSISRSLIKRQGGTMNVSSPGLNLGTRFWFTLPIEK
ncbi:MAG: ATP-binding protein [bacterium]